MRKNNTAGRSVMRSWLMPLSALALAGSLAGCVAYPAYPGYGYGGYGYGYGGPAVAYVGPPVVIGGGWGGGWHDGGGGGWGGGGGHRW